MKDLPLVSIFMTTKDRADLLPRALKSALNQTYQNIEIYIIDDGSSDNTWEVLEEYKKKDSRIKQILKNEISLGANPSRNKIIPLMSGFFATELADDDEFLPEHIELMVNNYDPKFAFMITNIIVILDENKKVLYERAKEVFSVKDMLDNCLVCPYAFTQRQRFIDAGLFDEKLKAAQDYDMYFRLMLKYGDVKALPNFSIIMYQEESRSRITTRIKEKFSGYLKVYLKYKYLMEQKHKRTQITRLYSIRKKYMSIRTFITLLFSKDELKKYKDCFKKLKEYELDIRYKYQRDFITQINNIKKDKYKYILYGYGEIGEFLLPIIKEKIVAIIDKSDEFSNMKEIEDKPLIKIENLINYPNDIIILVTPIVYKKEILNNLAPYGKKIVFLDNK